MEIFSFHPKLKKWVEIGNSGMFRPEMMEPMGMPADVSVIAWGLSLERCVPKQAPKKTGARYLQAVDQNYRRRTLIRREIPNG